MCRNIKTLFNFDPPATDAEIRAASLQFVRKLSGTNRPSRANEAAFNRAVEEVTDAHAFLKPYFDTNLLLLASGNSKFVDKSLNAPEGRVVRPIGSPATELVV